MNDGASSDAQYQLAVREAELARVQKIGQIGGLTVDLRGGEFRNTRSPEYLVVHGLPPEAVHESHEDWVRRIHPDDRERVVSHFLATVGSAHVMGGCTMAADAARGVVRPDGQHWQLANLSVHDGSLFPTSLGANPQLTVYGLAARLTSGLIQRLGGKAQPLA